MRNQVITGVLLSGLMIMTAGCTSHYQVTDPAFGKTYYTTKIGEAGKAGAVKIKDGKTGSTVTLQSSEVKEISASEYEAGVAAGQPAPKR